MTEEIFRCLIERMFNGMNGIEILKNWPRYEDGELVAVGDIVVCDNDDVSKVKLIEFRTFGSVVVCANGETVACDEPLERSAPKVYDADGVPIKVGDTLWRTSDAREFEVTGIGGAFEIRVKDESMETSVWTTPFGFTHANPEQDTWERVEDDATLSPREYYARYVGHDVGLKNDEEVNGAFGMSLVRRCKALSERGER